VDLRAAGEVLAVFRIRSDQLLSGFPDPVPYNLLRIWIPLRILPTLQHYYDVVGNTSRPADVLWKIIFFLESSLTVPEPQGAETFG
jgi:hypothetical protein